MMRGQSNIKLKYYFVLKGPFSFEHVIQKKKKKKKKHDSPFDA
jgi:hypothetical protein